MSAISATPTPLAGLWQIDRHAHVDSRGSFARLFCDDVLRSVGWDRPIRQINHSVTEQRGIVRGLHFQFPPHGETKLVTCLSGAIFDVAVDLRCGSPTYLHWHGIRLDENNRRSLLIPRGFAHGFQALSDHAVMIYLHDAAYDPNGEGGISPLDPRIAIAWPLAVTALSARDAALSPVGPDFSGLPA